ncbi:AraC family transcriptional regulator [Dyadobacter sp. CY312]|uniref:helix-turn-helix domain-containing protein n=1 Tax=Dyadobacter sp. CY312 TaxID=2907303 RepID=UPI001F344247|nr:helix-turn-helix domain-containing protein [Dyadobacter sp. CY312]MCE7041677.1 helix-turn-helix domain-containing protein [Dyadobacter sp. CY312]
MESDSKIQFVNDSHLLDKPALLFANPMTPYDWEGICSVRSGYICIFNLEFLENSDLLKDASMALLAMNGVYYPDQNQFDVISALFEKMLSEQGLGAHIKSKLLPMYVKMILMETSEMPTETVWSQPIESSSRLTSLFLELLNEQFYNSDKDLDIVKMPSEFADKLHIHTNHLNSSVQATLGKATTVVIQEKIVHEAKKKLKNTNWTISEISSFLGFDYPNSFTKFFKKHTGVAPQFYRR